MEVLLLTLFVSVCLAAFFAVSFWLDHAGRGAGGLERDSLLPLEEPQIRGGGGARGGVDPAEGSVENPASGEPPISTSL